MALLPKLRQLMKRKPSPTTVGARRPRSGAQPGDTPHEDALRAMLNDDPNDPRAFRALVEIVRRRASEPDSAEDPLTADLSEETAAQERQRRGDLAVWALAEELAGHPKAWYPLVELARLSLGDDHEGAVRRLVTAAERDSSGHALAEGLAVLREAGQPVEALSLGVGHWRAREHELEAGRQLVLASIEAGRSFEARHHLESLALSEVADKQELARAQAELGAAIDAAEAQQS